jgi:hypothetical protein
MKDILKTFAHQTLYQSGHILFKTLGVNLQTKTAINVGLAAFNLKQNKAIEPLIAANPETYFLGTIDENTFGRSASPLFAETDYQETLKQATDGKYKGIIVIGVHFKNEIKLNRTDLGNLTRAFNQASANIPVILLMQYKKNQTDCLSIAATERGDFKQSWRTGEKIGKISILKDIDLQNPHTGHWRILEDMKAQHLSTFEDLHLLWQDVFNIEKLNKKFYKELQNWYFWALREVTFPNDVMKDDQTRNPTNTIRLITRLMFVWFLREKNLIPDWLFDEKELNKILDGKQNDTYYNAILQNLFFATLNRDMNERGFALDKGFHGNKDKHSVYNLYRNEAMFSISPDEIVEKFKTIPFLNGGLFECLDSRKKAEGSEKEKSLYIDGFTRYTKKRAIVPNKLFFGEEQEIDLSDIYGDSKRNNEKVKGLFQILNAYKFTVAENTPIEQEIALDPELLGQVFENLLASFNPETQTTARKQTGSFYTPREIVDYMVDESLLAYLMQQVEDAVNDKNLTGLQDLSGLNDDLETKLRNLIGYDTDENPFDKSQSEFLVDALHRCKILDPACGSGAFPMGVLLKMTHILSKLDHDNQKWKAAEIEKRIKPFLEDKKQVEKIGYEAARNAAIEKLDTEITAIETAFGDNEADYARKLYLIENCIYGIDIQPIAVQISKLRFFISLVVNQNEKPNTNNRGILPLPNLETKFVAANTLIGLDKPKQLTLRNPKIEKLENELKDIRKKHFNAQNRGEKEKCRKADKKVRNEIAELLKSDNWDSKTAEQLAAWNPYNQNDASDFFDMEWMFGISDGFDIVIGNPPYVRADNPAIAELRNKIVQSNYYETLYEKWDLMVPFYEKGLKLLNHTGIQAYVASNSITTSKYAEKLQEWIIKNYTVQSINYFENVKVFDAGVVPVITIINANKTATHGQKIIRKNEFDNIETKLVPLNTTKNLRSKIFKKEFSDFYYPNVPTEILGEICYISVGIVPNADEKQAKGLFDKDDLISDTQTERCPKPYVEGKMIDAYEIHKIKYFEWNTDRVPALIRRPTFPELYEGEKILRGRVTKGTYDDTGIICNDSIVVFKRFVDLQRVEQRSITSSIAKNNLLAKEKKAKATVKKYLIQLKRENLEKFSERFDLKYMLAIINSTYAMAYMNNFRRHRLENYFYPDDFRKFPMPIIELSAQEPFIKKVNEILTLKKANADTTALEQDIDNMVYKLYDLTYEEVLVVQPDFEGVMNEGKYESFDGER